MRRRSDTRDRIQQVALEMFTEQGYERTSLREIAERLEVTKAALYYHFKTKEDILAQMVDDTLASLDELIAWAREQPKGPDQRAELVRRYAATMDGYTVDLMRFLQENQTVVRELKSLSGIQERTKALFELVSDPSADLAEQMRCRLALISIHLGRMAFRGRDIDDAVLADTALQVALDLVAPRDSPASVR